MNNIDVRMNTSIYPVYEEPYPDFCIDGVFLNALLDSRFPGRNIAGLVPPVAGWLSDKADEAVFWSRILPDEGTTTTTPVLICPDDMDFSCTTIVVVIMSQQEIVRWKRFGADTGYIVGSPDSVGSAVEWFAWKDELIFDRQVYVKAISTLRQSQDS